jgi:predicted alpha/beta superfamily hydrolase
MLHSKIVDDEYELSIYLPPSYESSEQAYPTLYVLDSPFVFGSAVVATAGQNLDAGVPEMIVVGIGKRIKNFDEWGACRWRDYTPVPYPDIPGTGYAAAFLNFLEQECIPFIDTHYRTQPNDRKIRGNSMGGLFARNELYNKTYLVSRNNAIAPAFVMGDTMILDNVQPQAVESLPS